MKRRIEIRDADSGGSSGEREAKRICLCHRRNIATNSKPFNFGRTTPLQAVFNFTEGLPKPIEFNACRPTRQARRKMRSLAGTLKTRTALLAINQKERVP
uniref:Uncharacterized protein n=1 Tax=Glossina palpalis gambiensis TaxID=67801 RepID=A0A1B0B1Q5_9MUSC